MFTSLDVSGDKLLSISSCEGELEIAAVSIIDTQLPLLKILRRCKMQVLNHRCCLRMVRDVTVGDFNLNGDLKVILGPLHREFTLLGFKEIAFTLLESNPTAHVVVVITLGEDAVLLADEIFIHKSLLLDVSDLSLAEILSGTSSVWVLMIHEQDTPIITIKVESVVGSLWSFEETTGTHGGLFLVL